MAKKDSTVEVPVTVVMPKEAYERVQQLIEGDTPAAQKVETVCNQLVKDLSEGGLMLSGLEMQRIRDSVPDGDAAGIIEAVEEGAGTENGQLIIKWRLDPTLVGPIQEIADSQGMTVDEVTQNLMDTCCDNGWFYDFLPKAHALFMDEAEFKNLAAVVGNPTMTGTDLLAWLKEKGVLESTETLDEILTGLGGGTEEKPEPVEA
jgi:hypothetical protein